MHLWLVTCNCWMILVQVEQDFPRSGSEMTPVHRVDDFAWTDYSPMVFRRYAFFCSLLTRIPYGDMFRSDLLTD